MVRCFICGKDATGGFVHGYLPEPEEKKVGLCVQHNTTDNKKKAILFWIRQQKADVERLNFVQQHRLGSVAHYTLVIRYMDGGVVSRECAAWKVVDESLQLVGFDGSLSFIPLQHIRQFDITSLQE